MPSANPRRNEFLCCIVAHCQQAIEKAVKGLLLQRGATFQFTHQIIDWIFHTPGYANYRQLLRRKLQPEVLSAALAIERLAPTPDTAKNTEYPYIYEKDGETKIGIPAREFKEPEVMIALRTARIVVGAILRIPPHN